jgi:hypothetical protein
MIREVITVDGQQYYAMPAQPDIFLPLEAALDAAEMARRIAACPSMDIRHIQEEWGLLQDSPAYETVPDVVKQQIAAGACMYAYRQWWTFPDGQQYVFAVVTEPTTAAALPEWLVAYQQLAGQARQRAYIRAGWDQRSVDVWSPWCSWVVSPTRRDGLGDAVTEDMPPIVLSSSYDEAHQGDLSSKDDV